MLFVSTIMSAPFIIISLTAAVNSTRFREKAWRNIYSLRWAIVSSGDHRYSEIKRLFLMVAEKARITGHT